MSKIEYYKSIQPKSKINNVKLQTAGVPRQCKTERTNACH